MHVTFCTELDIIKWLAMSGAISFCVSGSVLHIVVLLFTEMIRTTELALLSVKKACKI